MGGIIMRYSIFVVLGLAAVATAFPSPSAKNSTQLELFFGSE